MKADSTTSMKAFELEPSSSTLLDVIASIKPRADKSVTTARQQAAEIVMSNMVIFPSVLHEWWLTLFILWKMSSPNVAPQKDDIRYIINTLKLINHDFALIPQDFEFPLTDITDQFVAVLLHPETPEKVALGLETAFGDMYKSRPVMFSTSFISPVPERHEYLPSPSHRRLKIVCHTLRLIEDDCPADL